MALSPDINNELLNLESNFKSLSDSIKGYVEGLASAAGVSGTSTGTNNANQAGTQLNSTLKTTSSLFRDIYSTQQQIYMGQLKGADLSKKAFQLELQKASAIKAARIAHAKGDQEATKQALEQLKLLTKEQEALKLQKQLYEEIQKKMGVTGFLGDQLKRVRILNDLLDLEEAYGNAAMAAGKKNATRLDATKAYFKSIKETATSAEFSTKVLALSFAQAYKTFKNIDTETAAFAKNMGLSFDKARAVRSQMEAIAFQSGDFNITASKLLKTQEQLSKALKVNVSLSAEDLILTTKLRDLAGMETEQIAEIVKLSKARGVSVKQATSSLLGQLAILKAQTGINFDNKEILDQVAKTSAIVKVNFKGSTEALVAGTVAAKQLGVTLDQLDNIAGSLVQFESSITAELQAELLTGKQLNLERARYYALTNKTTELGKELMAQGITMAKFGSMNRIQQEATAKALGMSREDMAKMLLEQETLTKLSNVEGKSLLDKYNTLVKQYGVEKAREMIGNDQLAQQLASQGLQEKLNALADKFLTLFEKFSPVFEKVVGFFTKIVDALVASERLIKGIAGVLGMMAGMKIWSLFTRARTDTNGLANNLTQAATDAVASTATNAGSSGASSTSSAAIDAVADAATESATTPTPPAAGGGFFGGLKSLFTNPKQAITNAFKSFKGNWKNMFKGGAALGGILTTLLGVMDIKNLIANPYGADGKELTDQELNKEVGRLVAGTAGGAIGTALGTALGGPIGGLVGSFGGSWLFEKIMSLFPDAQEGIGEGVVDAFGGRKKPETAMAPEYKGEQLKDFTIKSLPEDTIVGVGGTKLGRTDEMVALLKEVKEAILATKDVYMDGSKVTDALRLGSFNTGKLV